MQKPNINGRRVIQGANLPLRMPWAATLVLYLFLDHLHAPGWLWGAVGCFVVFVWALWVWAQFTDVRVDVLRDPHHPNSPSDMLYNNED